LGDISDFTIDRLAATALIDGLNLHLEQHGRSARPCLLAFQLNTRLLSAALAIRHIPAGTDGRDVDMKSEDNDLSFARMKRSQQQVGDDRSHEGTTPAVGDG
jgi:hypothetical protein